MKKWARTLEVDGLNKTIVNEGGLIKSEQGQIDEQDKDDMKEYLS